MERDRQPIFISYELGEENMNITKEVTQFSSFYVFFVMAAVFMLIVWLIVLLKTVKGVAFGKIFLPAP